MEDKDTLANQLVNPRRRLHELEEKGGGSVVDTKKGVDKGDLPGPAVDFFKPRNKKDKSGPPAEMLRRHYDKK